jgi:hypothetical protein
MQIETRKISELKLDPRNARKHPDANLKALAASLSEFGQRKPIVVDKNGLVVAGNGTLTAAKNLGWTQIEVAILPADWDKQKVKAYALVDNRSSELATWDAHELLAQLESLSDSDFDMTQFGFEDVNAPEYEAADTVDMDNPAAGNGLGNPIISFEIVFDDADQQSKWFDFLRVARSLYPNAHTNAERITTAISEWLEMQE